MANKSFKHITDACNLEDGVHDELNELIRYIPESIHLLTGEKPALVSEAETLRDDVAALITRLAAYAAWIQAAEVRGDKAREEAGELTPA